MPTNDFAEEWSPREGLDLRRSGLQRRTPFSEVMRAVCDFPVTQIIQGGASGADRMAVHWAMDRAIQVKEYLPEWAHGRKAGPIRNQRMLDEGKPELVIAFPGGKGTADMVRRAKKAGVRVIEVPNLCGLAKV